MKRNFIFVFITIIASGFFKANAQPLRRLNSFSYNINDGLLQSHVWDMNFDGFGFIWLSFETGLQRYDGHSFINIPVQKGLPDNQYIRFIKTKNGLIWLCHSKGISVYNAQLNRFLFVYKFSSKSSSPELYPVNEDDSTVYFYCASGYIVGINENTLKAVSINQFPFISYPTDASTPFRISGLPVNHEITICFDQVTLIRWNLQKGKAALIYHLQKTKTISREQFYPFNKDQLICFNNGQLNLLNFYSNQYSIFAKNGFSSQVIDEAYFEYLSDKQILVSINNNIFLFNPEKKQCVAKLVNFQNQSFAHFPIRFIRFDDFGNIYLITRNEGFVKLLAATYPISYYGAPEKEFNFITSIEVDKKNNRLLAASLNSGLLIFDTLQKLQKHILQIGVMQQPGPLTIVGIIHIKDEKYLLFPRGNENPVLWNALNNKMKIIPVKIKLEATSANQNFTSTIAYYNSKLTLNDTCELIAIDQNLYQINPSNISSLKLFCYPYRMKGLLIYQNYILTGVDDKLFFMKKNDYSVVKKITIPDCGEVRCITTFNNYIYAGCNRGLFKLNEDGKVIASFTKQNGLPDDYIYSIASDDKGNVWCSSNKGIIRIGTDNSILHLKKEDGLQENEFNTNMLDIEADGQLFWGGVNGINSFYPEQITNINDSQKVILTNLKVNDKDLFKDSAIWKVREIHLPYDQNNLFFEFTAFGKRNPDQYLYQYKMIGIDKDWIENADSRNARYLLQPGKYSFQVYAGDVYNENPKNIKSIEIIISPPFWQTWWFRFLIIFSFIVIIVLIVRQYLNIKYQKKLRLLQVRNEIQQDRERISRDLHDNIGAQLSFISGSIDWIIDKNKEMDKEEELKQMKIINGTAKNAMVNLRETIWALNKDKITLQEFSDKLKVYIQNMLQLQPLLQLKTEERIDKNFILTPTEMINIFSICQECVNNALKYSHASMLKLIIHSDENSFHIYIEDNGIGFDSSKIHEGHYGLENMKHRAKETNAILLVKSEEGKGTRVEIGKYSK